MQKHFAALFVSLTIFSFSSFAYGDTLRIIQKPISFNEERVRLSLEYLKQRHNIIKQRPTIDPKIVVIHYTAGGTISSIHSYFNSPRIEDERAFNKKQSALNVSSHYLIDRDGTVYQLLPDTLFARHIIGLNYCAIGIENIGSDKAPLTPKQIQANISLVRHLCKKYKIEYLIGHSEYGVFRGTALWKETNPGYFTGKSDPGPNVMNEMRNALKDLGLKKSVQ